MSTIAYPPEPRPARGERSSLDGIIGDWAEAHYGLISYRRLRALGLGRWEIHRRTVRGTLRPAAPGVFYVGHRSGAPGQREALALADAGPGAALSGVTAAAWRQMTDGWHGPVHLIAPRSRALRTTEVVRHSDVLDPGDVTTVRGLACVTPERAVMDLPRELLRQALQWLMRNRIAVEPIVERMAGRRGVCAFREEAAALNPILACTLSELEARFVQLCRRYRIPLPTVNGTLIGGDLIDCSWPGSAVIVELDGRRWHEHRDREDRARDRRRMLEGRLPFRYGWFDVTRDAERTANELLRALAGKRNQPAPA